MPNFIDWNGYRVIEAETAEEAIRRIQVVYEDMTPIMSIADGVRPTKEPIQAYAEQGNIHKTISFEFGNTTVDRSEIAGHLLAPVDAILDLLSETGETLQLRVLNVTKD